MAGSSITLRSGIAPTTPLGTTQLVCRSRQRFGVSLAVYPDSFPKDCLSLGRSGEWTITIFDAASNSLRMDPWMDLDQASWCFQGKQDACFECWRGTNLAWKPHKNKAHNQIYMDIRSRPQLVWRMDYDGFIFVWQAIHGQSYRLEMDGKGRTRQLGLIRAVVVVVIALVLFNVL